jgi:ATPase family associated with various cellular activities (AAA)
MGAQHRLKGPPVARSDLVVRLAELATRGDQDGVRRTVEAMAAEERRQQHHVVADRLLSASRLHGQRPIALNRPVERSGLLDERSPARDLASLWLPAVARTEVDELIEEQARANLLRSHGLEPRHRILLVGPPGNGKTSLAEAIANELGVPILRPAYHKIIGSLLGETADRLNKVFDEVCSRACLLFLDEIDAVAKDRGDAQETGEIKRVVSSLLLNLDRLPSHVVVVGATNHPDLLDRALWRRFELRLQLPSPDRDAIESYLEAASKADPCPWGVSATRIAEALGPLSFSELEQFVRDIRRRMVLDHEAKGRQVVERCLKSWQARAGPMTEP